MPTFVHFVLGERSLNLRDHWE